MVRAKLLVRPRVAPWCSEETLSLWRRASIGRRRGRDAHDRPRARALEDRARRSAKRDRVVALRRAARGVRRDGGDAAALFAVVPRFRPFTPPCSVPIGEFRKALNAQWRSPGASALASTRTVVSSAHALRPDLAHGEASTTATPPVEMSPRESRSELSGETPPRRPSRGAMGRLRARLHAAARGVGAGVGTVLSAAARVLDWVAGRPSADPSAIRGRPPPPPSPSSSSDSWFLPEDMMVAPGPALAPVPAPVAEAEDVEHPAGIAAMASDIRVAFGSLRASAAIGPDGVPIVLGRLFPNVAVILAREWSTTTTPSR